MSSYFEVPKILDTHPKYQCLSVEARYLYAHMRDTLKLSIKNNWQDENGFYIRMARLKMAELLHRSLPTVRRILRELLAADLLREKREGLTRSNRLYVQMVEGEDELTFQCKAKKVSLPDKIPDFTLDRKPSAPNQPHSIHPHPTEPENKGWKWFIKEGSKWFDKEGKLWQFIDGEVCPYVYGNDYVKGLGRLLDEVGLGEGRWGAAPDPA